MESPETLHRRNTLMMCLEGLWSSRLYHEDDLYTEVFERILAVVRRLPAGDWEDAVRRAIDESRETYMGGWSMSEEEGRPQFHALLLRDIAYRINPAPTPSPIL